MPSHPVRFLTLTQQRSLVEQWLASGDARLTARRLTKRRCLDVDADELIHDAWIRVTTAFSRRNEPFPDMTDDRSAARYGARILDNLTRDRLGSMRSHTGESIELADGGEVFQLGTNGGESVVVDRMVVEQLLHAVARRGDAGTTCAGCQSTVVVAATLEVIHMILNGDEGGDRGRTWFDKVLRTALDRVDPHHPRSKAAADQRISRCGRCISLLLAVGYGDINGRAGAA